MCDGWFISVSLYVFTRWKSAFTVNPYNNFSVGAASLSERESLLQTDYSNIYVVTHRLSQEQGSSVAREKAKDEAPLWPIPSQPGPAQRAHIV